MDWSPPSIDYIASRAPDIFKDLRAAIDAGPKTPNLAMVAIRQALEKIIDRVWSKTITDDLGTRPLENKIDRLKKEGCLGPIAWSYACLVKELGNVGAHDKEHLTLREVRDALTACVRVADWYFSQPRFGAPPPVSTETTSSADNGKLEVVNAPTSLAEVSRRFALDVAGWFASRFSALQECAAWTEFMSNERTSHLKGLRRLAKQIEGLNGGFYTLDNAGVVLQQHTPRFPEMPDISGYQAGHKEYFVECQRFQRAVVCNSFTSANRREEILVIAVPRFNSRGQFIGIVDAVIDLCSSPFSRMAENVLVDAKTQLGSINLYLLDARHIALGSNLPGTVGRSMGGSESLIKLISAGGTGREFGENCWGAYHTVVGTPFVAFAVRCVENVK